MDTLFFNTRDELIRVSLKHVVYFEADGIDSRDMITKTTQRAIIGSFLITGTLLALYLTISVGYDLFGVHNAWMYRDGLMQKIVLVLLYADIPLLSIAGLTSTISFFRKGHIWKPVAKGIIVNILILCLILAGIILINFAF